MAAEQMPNLEAQLRQDYYHMAVQLVKNNQLSQAVVYFEKAKQLGAECERKTYSYYNMLGLCYYQLGAWEKARSNWRQSLSLFQESSNRAALYLDKLESPEAAAYIRGYEQALQAIQQKQYLKAEKILEKSRTLGIETVQLWQIIGLCQCKRGKNQQALISFKRALEKDVSNERTLSYLRRLDVNSKSGIIGRLIWKITTKP